MAAIPAPNVRKRDPHPRCRARALAVAIVAVLLGSTPAAGGLSGGTARAIDWNAAGEEAAALLSSYLSIDTTNPPGNEITAARFLAGVLSREGLHPEIAESAPGRGNVVARRRGAGEGETIVLLHHLDVVPARPAEWTAPPFAGVRRGGYVYGRGALDSKGIGIAQLMALLLIQRRREVLQHDIVFLATADEETGGRLGAGWVVRERRGWLRGATVLLNEGDYIHVEGGRAIAHVAVAEKSPCWLRLVAHGRGGHGSTPPAQTAVTRLIRALGRVQSYEPPPRVVPAVASQFAALATWAEDAAERTRLTNLPAALADPAYRARFEKDPRRHALIHNTITPTVLSGAPKTNVIPTRASADLDCRLLPGEDAAAFVGTIRRLVDDPDIEVETLLVFPSSSSPAQGPFLRAVRRVAARELESANIVPSVIAGFTDSHYFRQLGIPSYGFAPFAQPPEEHRRVHAADERLSTEVLREGIRFLYGVLRELG